MMPRSMALVDQIMAIMEAAFDPAWGEAWNKTQLGDALSMPHTFADLIDQTGESCDPQSGYGAGFVLARHAADEEELLLLAVRPEFRRRGLGQRLITRLTQAARARGANRIFLEMRSNNPAEALYRRCGFSPIGKRSAYYRASDGSRIDAITFAIEIDQQYAQSSS